MLGRLIGRFARAAIRQIKRILTHWHIIQETTLFVKAGITEAQFNALPEAIRELLQAHPAVCSLVREAYLPLDALHELSNNDDPRHALERTHIRELIQDRYLSINDTFTVTLSEEAFSALADWRVEHFLRQNGHITPEHLGHFTPHACLGLKRAPLRSLIRQGHITSEHLRSFTEETLKALQHGWVRRLLRQGFPIISTLTEPGFSEEQLNKNALEKQLKGSGATRFRHAGVMQLLKKHKLSFNELRELELPAFEALKNRGIRLLVQDGFMTMDQLKAIVAKPEALQAISTLAVRQKMRKAYFCAQDLIDNQDFCNNLNDRRFRSRLKAHGSDSRLTLPIRVLIKNHRPVRGFLKRGWITVNELRSVPDRPTEDQATPLLLFKNKKIQTLIRQGHAQARWIWGLKPEAARCFPPSCNGRLNLAELITKRYIKPEQLNELSKEKWQYLARYNFRLLIKKRLLNIDSFKKLNDNECKAIDNSLTPEETLSDITQKRELETHAYLIADTVTTPQKESMEGSWSNLRETHKLGPSAVKHTLDQLETDLKELPSNNKEDLSGAATIVHHIRQLSDAKGDKNQPTRLALLALAIKVGSFKEGGKPQHILSLFAGALLTAKKTRQNWQFHSLSFLAPHSQNQEIRSPQFATRPDK